MSKQAELKEASGENGSGLDFEGAVLRRYERAAREAEVGLCVPVSYDRSLLEVIHREIV